MAATPVARLIEALQGKNFAQENTADINQAAQIDMVTYPPPAGFTDSVPFDTDMHLVRNWAGNINLPQVYVYKPLNVDQCVFLANDAANKGFKLRPVGKMHNWSPLMVDAGVGPDPAKIYFVNTANLGNATFQMDGAIPTATFGTGITIDDALSFLKSKTGFGSALGYSFINFTAPGDVTIGGVLAIGAHGTSVYSAANPEVNAMYGCLSNLVRSFTAIVSQPGGGYALKTFNRADKDAAAFLVHLGRAFIVEVTMQVVPNYYVELTSWYPPVNNVFEEVKPIQSPDSLQTFVETYGRVEIIYFPYTDAPWVKTWKQVPALTQNPVTDPYPFKFADNLSLSASDFIQGLFIDAPGLTPLMTNVFLDISRTAAHGRHGYVMSGMAKDLMVYAGHNTLRVTALGYAIQIRRRDIQKTANAIYTHFDQWLKQYTQNTGKYPVNGPLEIRVTGLDDPALLNIAGAEAPLLSASSPINPANKDIDTVFWVDIMTLPQTPGMVEFFESMETFIHTNWGGSLRPEWSKGWGYSTDNTGWSNPTVLGHRIPDYYGPALTRARQTLDSYDQQRIYSSALLDKVMP